VATAYVWRVRNAAGQLVFASFEKRLVVPQFTFALGLDTTHTVTLTLNGVVNASSVFTVSRLPPVAIISGGDSLRLSTSGGRINAAQSYDPNYAATEQPEMLYSWGCQGIDLSLAITSRTYLDIPSGVSSTITCTVTVTSGPLSSSSTAPSLLMQHWCHLSRQVMWYFSRSPCHPPNLPTNILSHSTRSIG
jgi:hypothetical protein